jgi:hypothetical protein
MLRMWQRKNWQAGLLLLCAAGLVQPCAASPRPFKKRKPASPAALATYLERARQANSRNWRRQPIAPSTRGEAVHP